MLTHPRLHFNMAEQNGRLECSIVRRTGGRVYDLRVETIDGRVIVRGRADSYHVKQLALAAVLEAFEASESQPGRVEMDIEVAPLTIGRPGDVPYLKQGAGFISMNQPGGDQ